MNELPLGPLARFASATANATGTNKRIARLLAFASLLLVALTLVAPSATAQTGTSKPPPQTLQKRCLQSSQYRQLDFWVGEWAVKNHQGRHVGNSSVQLILDRCVVFENWTGDRGLTGKSFNIFNRHTKKWEQIWVSNVGNVTKYTGEFKDGAMRYQARDVDEQGHPLFLRLTFFPLSADEVRQLGEASEDGGRTWKTQYDLYYHRKE